MVPVTGDDVVRKHAASTAPRSTAAIDWEKFMPRFGLISAPRSSTAAPGTAFATSRSLGALRRTPGGNIAAGDGSPGPSTLDQSESRRGYPGQVEGEQGEEQQG